ncbi:uncharacterized protein LOC109847383 [Asparagus officinalis]|uniref:uncharacterized protein LOC109847383 n=1 Tax=Asparagus officinalis TaxID=4686 RepID=UPI00098DF364|nr:uncharacterized protein LOC109847383 [Asparagus officinalis]
MFTVKSYYLFLNDGGVRYDCMNLWSLHVPLKVKVLVWLALRECLNTKDMLNRKGIQLEKTCCLCSEKDEDHAHLFLNCEFVYSIWRSIQFKLNTDNEFRMNSLKEVWLGWSDGIGGESNLKKLVWICSLIWCVWQERNDRLFSNKQKGSLLLLNKIVTYSTFWLGSKEISARAARLQERRRKKVAGRLINDGAAAGGMAELQVIQLE